MNRLPTSRLPTTPPPSIRSPSIRPPATRLPMPATLAFALAVAALFATVALLADAVPAPGRPHGTALAQARPGSMSVAWEQRSGFVGIRDTIDGNAVTDPALIERIERVAAGIPETSVAGLPRGPGVRYLAQGFTAGDDPGLTEGWFEDPAAALAFGCALDDETEQACDFSDALPATHAFESAGSPGDGIPVTDGVADGVADRLADTGAGPGRLLPGWRCQPLGMAIGAPAFEPDRCEWDG